MENSVPARPVDERGKTHIGTCEEDRRTQHRILIRIVLPPSEELRNAVDLIIVTTVWKDNSSVRNSPSHGALFGRWT